MGKEQKQLQKMVWVDKVGHIIIKVNEGQK